MFDFDWINLIPGNFLLYNWVDLSMCNHQGYNTLEKGAGERQTAWIMPQIINLETEVREKYLEVKYFSYQNSLDDRHKGTRNGCGAQTFQIKWTSWCHKCNHPAEHPPGSLRHTQPTEHLSQEAGGTNHGTPHVHPGLHAPKLLGTVSLARTMTNQTRCGPFFSEDKERETVEAGEHK